MSTTNRKDTKQIRFKGGYGLMIKDGLSEYENLGELVSGKLVKKSGQNSVTLISGATVKSRGATDCTVSVILAQTDQSIQNRIDNLLDKAVKLYLDNGKAKDGKKQCYYFPEAEIIDAMEIEIAGDKHQAIAIEISILPQSSNPSVTPSTGLPTEFGFTGASAVSGTNPYYVVVDEAAA